MITSHTFASTELVATVRPIPILDVANGRVNRFDVIIWSQLVRLIAVPPVARVVLVISAVPAHLQLVRL